MNRNSASVLVVGGSLVGLSSASFLAWRGVPTLLVETHASSHLHPRAVGYTARTLELFRTLGLGPRIPEAPPDFRLRRCKIESLAGEWLAATDWTPPRADAGQAPNVPSPEYSRHTGAAIAQDGLEPILRDRARELGAELRLGTQLVRFEQDGDGVTAWLREREGRESSLRVAYMIAADGSRSGVREALGIGRSGPGHLQVMRSVLFRAPLDEYLARGISQFEIEQPDLRAFLTTYGDGRWVLMFMDDVERDEATLHAALRRAIGRADVPIEIITTGRWDLSALISDRFASGRVFLAGDAAHTLPPTRGGFGANTGIHDAHNLAWKLAAVLSGASTPALLDSYDAERRPVAWGRLEQTFARPDYARHAPEYAERIPILDEASMEFGQLYRSTAVLDAGDDLPAAARPDAWAGQPGTRAPHLWLDRAGERISTLDLFERSWVLLSEDTRWMAAAVEAARTLGIEVRGVQIGVDVQPLDLEGLRAAFGIGPRGASLIRPDGIVGWRAVELGQDPALALTDALARVSSAARPR
ncbi:FAD-dependent monooxygenase [Nannocystaceae bacterium ST9]